MLCRSLSYDGLISEGRWDCDQLLPIFKRGVIQFIYSTCNVISQSDVVEILQLVARCRWRVPTKHKAVDVVIIELSKPPDVPVLRHGVINQRVFISIVVGQNVQYVPFVASPINHERIRRCYLVILRYFPVDHR